MKCSTWNVAPRLSNGTHDEGNTHTETQTRREANRDSCRNQSNPLGHVVWRAAWLGIQIRSSEVFVSHEQAGEQPLLKLVEYVRRAWRYLVDVIVGVKLQCVEPFPFFRAECA